MSPLKCIAQVQEVFKRDASTTENHVTGGALQHISEAPVKALIAVHMLRMRLLTATHQLTQREAAVVVEVRVVRVQRGRCREVGDGARQVVQAVARDAAIVVRECGARVESQRCCVVRDGRLMIAQLPRTRATSGLCLVNMVRQETSGAWFETR